MEEGWSFACDSSEAHFDTNAKTARLIVASNGGVAQSVHVNFLVWHCAAMGRQSVPTEMNSALHFISQRFLTKAGVHYARASQVQCAS